MSDVNVKDRDRGEAAETHGNPKIMAKHPTNPWEAEVDVYLTAAGPPAVFSLQTCLPVDDKGNIVFHNNGRPGFTINFRLYDNTKDGEGSGFVFPNPPDPPNQKMQWAMWSSKGEGCPPEGCGQWSEFTSTNVKDQGTTLVVRNTNKEQALFGYTLRVTNDGGRNFVNLDPGGNNMNGSSRA